MPQFDDANIRAIFGAEAAEDEDADKLKAYFIRNASYQNIRADLPLRILVGHKGIGKSALLKMSHYEDEDEDILSIWLQPNDIAGALANAPHFSQQVYEIKQKITNIILQKSLEKAELFGYNVESTKIIKSARELLDTIYKYFKDDADGPEIMSRAAKNFLKNRKIRIYIDDLDRGWAATRDDIKTISALINAARDLTNEERNIQFRIGLRTDAYYLVRTSDESTDKIEQNVVHLSWTNHDILVVMATRVARFMKDERASEDMSRLPQREVASYLNPVIVERFEGQGHWDRAPIHTVLLSLTRKRPRDLIKLLSGAARNAYVNKHDVISSYDLESSFSNYSNGRIQDLILEFRSEMPEIERLLYNMRPTKKESEIKKKKFLYEKGDLMSKLSNIINTQSLSFRSGKPVTPINVAEFLYKIDFIIARDGEDETREWVFFDQNRMLQSQFVDFGYKWEVHPAYRWALNPRSVAEILSEITHPSSAR
jgi:hypothetical protein